MFNFKYRKCIYCHRNFNYEDINNHYIIKVCHTKSQKPLPLPPNDGCQDAGEDNLLPLLVQDMVDQVEALRKKIKSINTYIKNMISIFSGSTKTKISRRMAKTARFLLWTSATQWKTSLWKMIRASLNNTSILTQWCSILKSSFANLDSKKAFPNLGVFINRWIETN